MHRPFRQPSRGAPRAAAVLALTLLLGVPLSACSGDDDPERDRPAGDAGPAREDPPPLATTTRLGEVAGRLSGPRRARMQTQVTEVVDAWIDAAYLGVYPRTDFGDAFLGFSEGAAADARSDAALMSNKSFGADLDEVVALQRGLRIDALASRGRAVGVTARVLLTMRLGGEVKRKEKVAGRLFLTYGDGTWQVFGYDVTRGRAR